MRTASSAANGTSRRSPIRSLAADVANSAGLTHEDILEATIVGNPIMHHLLLGIDPVELGGAPFALATDMATTMWASEIDLQLNRNARIYVLPCIAGHVGADAAGMVLAERPDLLAEMTLLVDVGTNAEIVLGNRDRLVACSSPTVPACEGAQISCGQRAAPGAIERIRVDRDPLEPRFKIIGNDLWSDQPGFDDAAAATGVIEELVRRIDKMETAIEPRFQQHFVEAMAIPHKKADYRHLRAVVDLPAPKESTMQTDTRGRRAPAQLTDSSCRAARGRAFRGQNFWPNFNSNVRGCTGTT